MTNLTDRKGRRGWNEGSFSSPQALYESPMTDTKRFILESVFSSAFAINLWFHFCRKKLLFSV